MRPLIVLEKCWFMANLFSFFTTALKQAEEPKLSCLLITPSYRESLITVILLQSSRHISRGWCESININIIYKASLLILRLIDGTLILPLNFQQQHFAL